MYIKEINLKYHTQSSASRYMYVKYISIWIFEVSQDVCNKVPIFWVKKGANWNKQLHAGFEGVKSYICLNLIHHNDYISTPVMYMYVINKWTMPTTTRSNTKTRLKRQKDIWTCKE